MHHALRVCIVILASGLAFAAGPTSSGKSTEPHIRLSAHKTAPTVELLGLSKEALAELAKLLPDAAARAKVFAVYVDRPEKERAGQPALLGTYRVDKDVVRFEPRFPLAKGVKYRAVFNPQALPGGAERKPLEVALLIPRPERKPSAHVTQVYPTAKRLPENLLRFYIHFSVPMSQGGSYQYIRLLGPNGAPVVLPFLELDQELWSLDGTRLTVLFDPGRIKRGLLPREQDGPILEEGKSYTLVIDRTWEDGDGTPMRESFRRTFSVGPPEDAALDIKTWKLTAPTAGGKGAVALTFPKALDHAQLHSMMWVEDAVGKRVAGEIAVTEGETGWRFTPAAAWRAGEYRVVADTELEDRVGNNLARPFEIDVFRPIPKRVKTQTARVDFRVK